MIYNSGQFEMIFCCGEALIDMIPQALEDGAKAYQPHCGGAVFNTAIALGRLGIDCGMVTGFSSDLFGNQLKAGLAQSGVDVSHVIISDRPTTLAFVKLENGQASYFFYDENSAGRMLTPSQLPDLPEKASTLYFGGISLACEPGADFYAALAEREAENQIIVIDPNIRPSFIADEAAYRKRLAGMLAIADIVKISDEDLNWINPGDDALEQKAVDLLDQGPKIVVLTKGENGATAFFSDNGKTRRIDAPAQKAKVVDTVGAGDTFNAGLMASLSEAGLMEKTALSDVAPEQLEQALKTALDFAARVAAVTVSRKGADPPWAKEL